MLLVAIAVATFGQINETRMTAAQFDRMMTSCFQNIKDVAFVYEGFSAGFPEGTPIESVSADQPGNRSTYQGSYSMKYDSKDCRSLIDVYATRSEPKPIHQTHDTYALFAGKFAGISRLPDQGTELQVAYESSGPGRMNQPESPERIMYVWYFQARHDYAALGFEDQGWEEVDGHRCLRVQIDVTPRATSNPDIKNFPFVRFWIDVVRSGHPLKVEYHNGFVHPGLNLRCHVGVTQLA